MPAARPKRPRTTSSSASHRSNGSRHGAVEKTEVMINVYDLLPPGRLSSLLWTIGSSLLHSGVVVNGREYAYGGHNKRDITGVYWTKPHFEPPGGRHRITLLQGFTFRTGKEIDAIIKEVSEEFLGTSYNLLTKNCNHFTSTLCERLLGKAAPGWLNRAASVGVALPCMVPREWVQPPEAPDTAEGEILDDDLDEEVGEDVAMLESDRLRRQRSAQKRQRDEEEGDEGSGSGSSLVGGRRLRKEETPPPRLVSVKDTSGREMPIAERAPMPVKKS